MVTTLKSLAAPEVVSMTTSGAASDYKVVTMTTFTSQCTEKGKWLGLLNSLQTYCGELWGRVQRAQATPDFLDIPQFPPVLHLASITHITQPPGYTSLQLGQARNNPSTMKNNTAWSFSRNNYIKMTQWRKNPIPSYCRSVVYELWVITYIDHLQI